MSTAISMQSRTRKSVHISPALHVKDVNRREESVTSAARYIVMMQTRGRYSLVGAARGDQAQSRPSWQISARYAIIAK
jgi:hypothetical protein